MKKSFFQYISAIVQTIGERAWEEMAEKLKRELLAKLKAGPERVKGVNPNIQKITFRTKTAKIENHLITIAEAKHLSATLQGGNVDQCVTTLVLKKTLTDGSDSKRELAVGITKSTGLHTVQVDHIEIPVRSMLFVGKEARGEFRGGDTKLTSLDWTKIGFDTSDADDLLCFIIAEILKDKRCQLLDLKLHPKQLGIDASYALGEALRINRTLKYIRLGANLPHELIRNNEIDEIDWVSKDVNSCDLIVLVEILKDNKSVRALKLSENSIDAKGVMALSDFLKTSKSIVAVDLSLNPNLGDDSMQPIKDMLLVNKSLQVLLLKGTGVSDNGAMHLAAALPKSGLKKLSLEYNKIGGLGCSKLVDAVDKSPQVQELHLENNQIPPAVKSQCGSDPNRVFL